MCKKCDDKLAEGASQPFSGFVSKQSYSEDKEMAEKPVALKLRNTVALPQTIILPMRLVNLLQVDRRYLITSRTQAVPQGIADFLRGDLRYAGWFEDAPKVDVPKEPAAAGNPPPAVPSQTETGTTTPPDGKEAPPAEDLWSEQQAAPVLRDYAKRFGVDVKSGDNKGEIVAKLKAARADFQIQPAGEGAPPA